MHRPWKPWSRGRGDLPRPRQVDRGGRLHWLWQTASVGNIDSLYEAVTSGIITTNTHPAVSPRGRTRREEGGGARRSVAEAQTWRTSWMRGSRAAPKATLNAFVTPSRDMDAWRWPGGAPGLMTDAHQIAEIRRVLHVRAAPEVESRAPSSRTIKLNVGACAPPQTLVRLRDVLRGRREVYTVPTGPRVVGGTRGNTLSDLQPPTQPPAAGGQWCRWSGGSRMWLQSSLFAGTC